MVEQPEKGLLIDQRAVDDDHRVHLQRVCLVQYTRDGFNHGADAASDQYRLLRLADSICQGHDRRHGAHVVDGQGLPLQGRIQHVAVFHNP